MVCSCVVLFDLSVGESEPFLGIGGRRGRGGGARERSG